METARPRFATAPAAAWRGFQRLTQLSFPRSYPIVQFPNLALILAFASGLAAHHTHGHAHADVQAVSARLGVGPPSRGVGRPSSYALS
jgi:hypothetical protein